MTALRQFLAQSRAVQVLLVNELTIFLSFFMLYPYLAVYFRDQLGFSAWTVGLVLGIRMLCQQGLTVIGGTIADRIGYKPVIIGGLALRGVGFGLFGFVTSLAGTLTAAILSGLAGAFFSPALRAYLATESAGRRAEVFALANLAAQIGTLLGPPVGVLLLGQSFRLVCVLAAALFLALTALQFRYLPRRIELGPSASRPVLGEWGEVLRNRTFLLYALVMLGYAVLWSQMYLAIPLEARRATGSDAGIGILFILSSLITIAGQVHVTAWCQSRYRPAEATVLGLAIMGVAWLPLALVTPAMLGPLEAGVSGPVAAVLRLGPALAVMVLLSVGMMVVNPFALAMVPHLARDRLIATHYGFYSLAAGVGATVGNAAIGLALDLQDRPGLAGLPWALMIALGAGSALALRGLDRGGRLD